MELNAIINLRANSVPKIQTVKKLVDILAELGYSGLYFGFSNLFEMNDEPYFGHQRGRYTKEDIKELDKYCQCKNIELRPAIQGFSQMYFLGKYSNYRGFLEGIDTYLPDDENAYAFIEKQIKCCSEFFQSRKIHLGLDDCTGAGLNNHLNRFGYEEKYSILLRHTKRVINIAKKYGFTSEIWSDNFIRGNFLSGNLSKEEIKEKFSSVVGEDTIISVRSYDFIPLSGRERIIPIDIDNQLLKNIQLTAKVSDNSSVTFDTLKWFGYAPDNDYSIRGISNCIKEAKRCNIDKFNVGIMNDRTGDCGFFSVLPSLYFASECANGRATSINDLNRAKFKKITGVEFDDFMLLDLPNKPYLSKNYDKPNNKCFIYLHMNVLAGGFDKIVSDGIGEAYGIVANKLKAVNGGDYQYLFDSLSSLCKVLEVKSELGRKIKQYYDQKNIAELEIVANKTIPELILRVNKFFTKFETAWLMEYKSFGMEVQTAYFGAIIGRLEQAKIELLEIVSGERSSHSLLDYERMLPSLFVWNNPTEDDILLYYWEIITNFDLV